MKSTHKILIIEAFKSSFAEDLKRLAKEHPELGVLEPILLTSQAEKYADLDLQVIATTYKPQNLKAIFVELGSDVKTVICRGDVYIQYLRKVLPYLDPDAFVSDEQSLRAATNKQLMRQAFAKQFPELSPRFINAVNAEVDVEKAGLTFPVIVKPANLASSILVQKCDDPEELRLALQNMFEVIQRIYAKEGRHDQPEIIVEEFLVGDFYSIDSYVLQPGKYFHCPPVSYVPAESMGIDDFFLYKRNTPTHLNKQQIASLNEASEKALTALNLQFSSAHIELVLTTGGWKIIEVGPRIGRFRNTMYQASYGINHGYNDLLVHCGLAPNINPNSAVQPSVAYSIYPYTEGVLREVTDFGEVQSKISHVKYLKSDFETGVHVKHAKNGGHALLELVFTDEDPVKFKKQAAWFETHVKAVTQPDGLPQIIGRAELIDFPVQRVKRVPARIDTGAKTSSLWATDIKETKKGLSFKLFGPSSPYYSGKKVITSDYQETVVASSIGEPQVRFKVNITIKLAGKKIKANFTLADRSKQAYPILIGRGTLRGKFVVDVKAGTVLTGREKTRTAELKALLDKKRKAD